MSDNFNSDTVFSADELTQFRERGWVHLRSAFPRETADSIRTFMWDQLRQNHGVDPNDPTTWRWTVNGLNRTAHNPVYRDVASPRFRSAFTQLLGHSRWTMPTKWGGFGVYPPNGGIEAWTVPTDSWHWDLPPASALMVFTLFAPLAPREGGTLIADGSHRLVRRFYESSTNITDRRKVLKREFNLSHSWLTRLTGAASSSSERIAEFTETTFDADGIPLRVSEVIGEPGDAVLCDSCIYHVRPTRIGPFPRFMGVKSVS